MDQQSESTHLLVNTASEGSPSPLQQKSVCISCPLSKHLCLPSKAAILILFWTIIVGTVYHNLVGDAAGLVVSSARLNTYFSMYVSVPYAILAIVMMFYPLSGFIADVYCGRLKTVVVSLIFLLSCNVMLILASLVGVTVKHTPNVTQLAHTQGILCIILMSLSLVTFIVGLAGYQANFIQLGLDQLFEAPSQYLGLFIHYAVLAFQAGSLSFAVIAYLVVCSTFIVALSLTIVINFSLLVLFLITVWKRQWLHIEPGHQNPYKTVYDIINFARSNKHPLQRSAFTYSDNYIPSRLDFAKERFGGPFTTEQVENVKSFFRILLILCTIGPALTLEVPASYFILPLFGLHFQVNISNNVHHKEFCTNKFGVWEFLIGSGIIKIIVTTVILFPTYIVIVFSLLRKRVPKLLLRLGIGISFCLLGVISLLITDTVGHVMNTGSFNNGSQCVLQATLIKNRSLTYPTLNMHWGVLIPPSLLLGIGPLLVIATTLEFISAQSPQSMKGLLVGVFFAIRGLFQFLNSIVIIPLSLKQPWASKEMIEHPPVTNCGSVYLVLTSVTGLIGLILFSVAAKRYKYRTRDEGLFRQHDVEEIYDRYIDQAAVHSFQSCKTE